MCVVGCPAWPRGQRIVRSHREIGIRHLDIYWGAGEVPTYDPRVNRYRRRRQSLISQLYYSMSQGTLEKEAFKQVVEEYREYIWGLPSQRHHQTSLVTISHPYHEEVRFYNSEVRVFEAANVQDAVSAGWLETVMFGQTQMPALDELAAEIVDALQIDGLPYEAARAEILTAGLVDPAEAEFIPQWFYRPVPGQPLYDRFCEEPLYRGGGDDGGV